MDTYNKILLLSLTFFATNSFVHAMDEDPTKLSESMTDLPNNAAAANKNARSPRRTPRRTPRAPIYAKAEDVGQDPTVVPADRMHPDLEPPTDPPVQYPCLGEMPPEYVPPAAAATDTTKKAHATSSPPPSPRLKPASAPPAPREHLPSAPPASADTHLKRTSGGSLGKELAKPCEPHVHAEAGMKDLRSAKATRLYNIVIELPTVSPGGITRTAALGELLRRAEEGSRNQQSGAQYRLYQIFNDGVVGIQEADPIQAAEFLRLAATNGNRFALALTGSKPVPKQKSMDSPPSPDAKGSPKRRVKPTSGAHPATAPRQQAWKDAPPVDTATENDIRRSMLDSTLRKHAATIPARQCVPAMKHCLDKASQAENTREKIKLLSFALAIGGANFLKVAPGVRDTISSLSTQAHTELDRLWIGTNSLPCCCRLGTMAPCAFREAILRIKTDEYSSGTSELDMECSQCSTCESLCVYVSLCAFCDARHFECSKCCCYVGDKCTTRCLIPLCCCGC